jgi:DNA-binding NarL/FixJ family response regulator
VKKSATVRALFALCRVVVVGDTCVSEEGMAAIVGRDKRHHVCGSAHRFYNAGKLIGKHQPDALLIEPFLEDRDGIRWIKDLATNFHAFLSWLFRPDQNGFMLSGRCTPARPVTG